MKYVSQIFLIVLLVGGLAVSVFADTPKMDAGTYDAQGELITVKAQGLVCEFCAKALEKVFMKREEVSGISVDLTSKEILISFKAGQTIDDATVNKLIIDSGYNTGALTRTPPK